MNPAGTPRRPSASRSLYLGALGGVAGGLVMAGVGYTLPIPMMHSEPFFVAAVDMMNFTTAVVTTAWALHVITSLVVGALFGGLAFSSGSFRPVGAAKVVALGLVTGLATFCLLFLPSIVSPMSSLLGDGTFLAESLGYNILFGMVLVGAYAALTRNGR